MMKYKQLRTCSFKFYSLVIQKNLNYHDISLEYVRLKDKQAKTIKQKALTVAGIVWGNGTIYSLLVVQGLIEPLQKSM